MSIYSNTHAPVTNIAQPMSAADSSLASTQDPILSSSPSPSGVREQFVSAMRFAVTGVNVVTTSGPSGQFGLTVSAMCPVSADPALLLVCINQKSPICDALVVNRVFCINVLSTQQHEIARVFSGDAGTAKVYDFGAAQWESGRANVARLIGAIATFDCELEDVHSAGTHRIFIGRVCSASTHSGTPLLHTDRSYGFPLKWA
jgi:flavin reductase